MRVLDFIPGGRRHPDDAAPWLRGKPLTVDPLEEFYRWLDEPDEDRDAVDRVGKLPEVNW